MEELSHPKPSNQDKPHSHEAPIQSHDYTIGIASQKSKTENGPQEEFSSKVKKKETKWWSIRTEYLFHEPEEF